MITNKVFDSEQIAVPIGETTYDSCCQMCVSKLNGNPESRYAVDPVSSTRIDKSEAVLGAAPDSTVYYFESLDNLRAFNLPSVRESGDGKQLGAEQPEAPPERTIPSNDASWSYVLSQRHPQAWFIARVCSCEAPGASR